MGKTVAVSFEGDSVKIVHASFRGKNLTVERTETVPTSEFDAYLRREKASEFIVTAEFREAYHDVVTTPVVKDQFLKKIVESEIRKVIIQKEFSFIYTIVGEKVLDNRKVYEVFYYAVPKETIRSVVERFYDNGKMVRALYHSVFPAASIIDTHSAGEANMGIFSAGKSRFAFFIKKGAIYFIRNYESFNAELSDFDIQNINMTISYCFQNLRTSPASVYLIGPLAESEGVATMSTAPLASIFQPGTIRCSRETFGSFILPIASFFTPGTSSILSEEFRLIYRMKSYMALASRAFIALVLICICAIAYEFRASAGLKDEISRAKNSLAAVEDVYYRYMEREEKIDLYQPLVEFLNTPAPNLKGLLVSLGRADLGRLSLTTVNATLKEGMTFAVTLQGIAHADTYTAMQDSIEHMTTELKKKGNAEITDRYADLKDRVFTIEMNYRAEE